MAALRNEPVHPQIRSLFAPVLAEVELDTRQSVTGLPRRDQAGRRTPSMATTRRTARWRWPRRSARSRRRWRRRSSPKLPANDMLEPPTVAGPGFINLRLKPEFLAKAVQADRDRPEARRRAGREAADVRHRLQQPERGQAAARRPPAQHDHRRRPRPGSCASSATRSSPTTTSATGARSSACCSTATRTSSTRRRIEADPVRELARLYVDVRKLFKEDRTTDDEDEEPVDDPRAGGVPAGDGEAARRRPGERGAVEAVHAALPGGDPRDLPPARTSPFDHTLGESFYNPMLPGVVEDMLAKGIADREPGGGRDPEREGNHPADRGGTEEGRPAGDHPQAGRGVHLHDHATWRRSSTAWSTWQPGRDPLRRRIRRRRCTSRSSSPRPGAGATTSVELEHIAFGSVLGEDRKPFQTRKGGAVELDELARRGGRSRPAEVRGRVTTDAQGAAGTKCPDLTEDEKRRHRRAVGIGAVKYADLSQNRTSDYIFELRQDARHGWQHGDVHAVRLRPLPRHLPQGRRSTRPASAPTRRR